MNNYAVIGRLTRDNDLKESNTGCYLHNTVAVDCGKGVTLFVAFSAFGKQAEILADYTNKGDKVGLVGRLEPNNYDKNDGGKVEGFKMNVNSVDLIGSGNGKEDNANNGGGGSSRRSGNNSNDNSSTPAGSSRRGGRQGSSSDNNSRRGSSGGRRR